MTGLNGILSGLLIGATFTIGILALYSYRKKTVAGAMSLFYLCLVSAFYVFGYGMELLSQDLVSVDFWSRIQYLGLPFIPAFWTILALAFTRQIQRYPLSQLSILFVIPFLTALFRWTSHWHHLQYGEMSLVSNGYFQVLSFERGPWYYIHFIYFFACAFYAAHLYYRQSQGTTGGRSKQASLMLAASLMPILSIVINLLGLFPLQLDSGPFFIILNYGIFAIGIFRYSFLSIIPLSKEKVFDWIADGVLVLDLNSNVLDFNPAAAKIFQKLSRNAMGEPLRELVQESADFVLTIEERVQALAAMGKESSAEKWAPHHFQFSVNTIEGVTSHYQSRLSELYDGGQRLGVIVMMTDTTKQHQMLLELEGIARTDRLTGLMNRGFFIDTFNALLDKSGPLLNRPLEESTAFGLIMLDIDHFKQINDRYGHLAGDKVLEALSACLKENLREKELVCRYGGEEFLILLPETDQPKLEAIAERLRKSVSEVTVSWEDKPIKFTASFGATFYDPSKNSGSPGKPPTFDHLVGKADTALYRAKDMGRNRVEIIQ